MAVVDEAVRVVVDAVVTDLVVVRPAVGGEIGMAEVDAAVDHGHHDSGAGGRGAGLGAIDVGVGVLGRCARHAVEVLAGVVQRPLIALVGLGADPHQCVLGDVDRELVEQRWIVEGDGEGPVADRTDAGHAVGRGDGVHDGVPDRGDRFFRLGLRFGSRRRFGGVGLDGCRCRGGGRIVGQAEGDQQVERPLVE